MQEKDRVQNWSIDVDDDDEPVVVGERGGAPFRSHPVARLDPAAGTARLVDGTILALGAPAEDVDPCDPLALPPGARRRRLDRTRAAIERLAQGEGPSSEELNRAPLLDSWAVADRAGLPVLTGIVTGHPRLPAHSWVRTSPLVWLAEDRTAARTSSRWYRLGSRLEDDLARSGRRTPA